MLFDIETSSLGNIQQVINSIRNQEEDVSPKYMSFTTSPKFIWKRFGANCTEDELSKKQQELLDIIDKNSIFLDILEYIVYKDYKKYEGDMFKDYNGSPDIGCLKAKKKESEKNINDFIEKMKKEDSKKLMDDVVRFHEYEKNKFTGKEEEFIFVLSDLEKLKKFIYFTPIIIPPILAMIFLRLPLNKKFEEIKEYIKNELMERDDVVDIYKLFGDEEEYLIKVWTKNMSELDDFINKKLYKEKISTGTKLVLRIWKKEGWYPTEKQRFPSLEIGFDEVDFKTLSIMDNYAKELSERNKEEQIDLIIDELQRIPGTNVIKEGVKTRLDKLRKEVVEKFSIKLECDEWLKTLIFIKASRGEKGVLGENINKFLLGVDNTSFARKYYHVSGEFDFIIPLDCRGLVILKTKIEEFVKNAQNMVSDIRVYFDLHKFRDIGGLKFQLKLEDIAFITALMPNSNNITRLPEKSPRYDCYQYIYKKEKQGKAPKVNFKNIEKYVTPTIELRLKSVMHVLIRFRISNKSDFNIKLENLKKQKEQIKKGIILKIYHPIHDANVVFCILMTSDFEALFNFINEFDDCCSSILPNLIFSQGFFELDIPSYLRCKPCISESKQCRACEQYPKPRDKANIHTRDLEIKGIDKCKIAIVQIKQKNESETNEAFVIGKLKEAIDNESNIIVFPELSIPKSFINKIEETIKSYGKDKKLFVVAGSHYKEEKENVSGKVYQYNVAPILYLSEEGCVKRYDDNYRNYPSSYDKEGCSENCAYGNNGIWRYINTGFGNFAVIICADFTAEGRKILENLRKLENFCDILIVIARNHGIKPYGNTAENEAKEGNRVIVITNNGDEGFGNSRFYVPDKEETDLARNLEESIVPADKEDIIYHTVDLIELDKSRGIEKRYLTKQEEEKLENKYFWRMTKSNSHYKPIHLDEWKNEEKL